MLSFLWPSKIFWNLSRNLNCMEFYGTVQYRKELFTIYWLSNYMKIQWLKSVKIVVFILFWKTVCKLVHEKLFFGARVQTLSTRYSVLLLLWSAILVQRKMFLKLKECDLGFFEVTSARIDLHKESANLQGPISFSTLSFLSDLCSLSTNSQLVAQSSCFADTSNSFTWNVGSARPE